MNKLEELRTRAQFKEGDPVHYCGIVHTVIRRYYRKSKDQILYDLREVVKAPARPRYANAVPEDLMHKPSLYTLGIDPHGGKYDR